MAADLRTDELEAATAMLHRFSMLIENGLAARFSGWLSSGGAWQDFLQGLKTADYSPALLALGIVAICLIAVVATAAVASSILGRSKARPLLSAAAWIAAALLVVLASWVLLLSLIFDPVLRRALLNCVVISAVATMICFPLTTGRRSIFSRWRRDLAVAIGIASGGLVVLACLRVWNAADPPRDLFATFAVSLPFTRARHWPNGETGTAGTRAERVRTNHRAEGSLRCCFLLRPVSACQKIEPVGKPSAIAPA
ncbi:MULTISPECIES: hypothetical protein [unclassified Bosea (in: a-proteobacteria)]|uniref:hypothetical protein n=1 Tax=unclassified Bosea (in: a-proteobacteria) TaxID=2653178 RepID=UPI000F7E7107|nr:MULTISPECIES: hypothetical protein [unclassified Bosea (in: a-proteobacteria)]RXT27270.1 hypothetical protein B5U98_00170 [Bosea sp. Tri-39]